MARLTKRRLGAMANALGAMLLAGEENQGDWDDNVTREDLETTEQWVYEQLRKRKKANA